MSISTRSLSGITFVGAVCIGVFSSSSGVEGVALGEVTTSQNILEIAELNDAPDKIQTYHQDRKRLVEIVNTQIEAYGTYQHLMEMTQAQIAETYPEGDYELAVAAAAENYLSLRKLCLEAQAIADASLAALTGGRALSEAALVELHNMQNI